MKIMHNNALKEALLHLTYVMYLTLVNTLNLVALINVINIHDICHRSLTLSIAYSKTNSSIDSYVKYSMAFVLT